MDLKHIIFIGAVFLSIGLVICQNEDELPMPEEKDNQFPSDFPPENETIEGSGVGAIENPADALETTTPVLLEPEKENVKLMSGLVDFSPDILSCPTECTCSQEGEGEGYDLIVDCSSKELTQLPAPIDTRATTLNLQNNKLTELPKAISELKNLKVLNVNNNTLKNLTFGTVSELPELRTLKLANNKLLDVPQELKNGFGLTKLEELDLGGNDIRDMLQTEVFSHFTNIQKLTLPSMTDVYVEQLCRSLSKLHTICTETCDEKIIDCPDVVEKMTGDDLIPVLPGQISADLNEVDSDPAVNSARDEKPLTSEMPSTTTSEKSVDSNTEISLRNAIDKETATETPSVFRAAIMSATVDTPSEPNKDVKQDLRVSASNPPEDPNGGGVDKSVVGIIIAVMIVVVAALVIKKNWSTIKNKFSSTPRPGTERPQAQSNGTAPEEVPLQEKSSV